MRTVGMKSYIVALSLAATSFVGSAQAKGIDPVVMTINGKEIRKSEFEYIYNKNNSNNAIDKKSLNEYVELFKNYKLKVAEAERLGVDTTAAFRNELKGYRTQLAQPYLVDRSVDEAVIHEAYSRLVESVSVRHILVKVDPAASPSDTLAAYQKLSQLREQIVSGANFSEVAQSSSECPSSAKGGDLGFITGFMTVYPFESAAYHTAVGSISPIVRTQFGYHIIQVDDRRADMGELLAAHIMKEVPRNATPEQEAEARRIVEECAAKMAQGGDFAALALEFSDDKYSANKGGELNWFGVNRLPKAFEVAAYALQSKGDVSLPVRTDYGWHLIKLLDKRGVASFEEKREEITRRLAGDERASRGRNALITRLRKAYDVTKSQAVLDEMVAAFSTTADTVLMAEASSMKKCLVKINGKDITQGDYINYLSKRNYDGTIASRFEKSYTAFEEQMILDYEDSQLEAKYPEFRHLMQEYRDGILLFDVSNSQVWEKASKDHEGLKRYFETHSAAYRFETPRFKGFVAQCKDAEVAERIRAIIASSPADSVLTRVKLELNSDGIVARVNRLLCAKGDNPMVDAYHFGVGTFVPTTDFPVAIVVGKQLETLPEEYEDVKGMVTADYQNWLEKEWVAILNRQFKVKLNNKVIKTVKGE